MKKTAYYLIITLCLFLLFGTCGTPATDNTPSETTAHTAQSGPTSFGDTEPLSTELTVNTLPSLTEDTAGTLPENSSFEIHFIDVGQADAALVLCDGESLLIDGGNAEDSSLMYAYLKEHGITHLSRIMATHAHEDHVGGLAGALNYATVDVAYSPVTEYDSKAFQNYVKALSKQGITVTVPTHGDSFTLGSAHAEILGPIATSDEPNNTSIVLRITYGNTRFLFTGDAETLEENGILDAGYNISCDVLKVGHHGSDTSTGYRWLREAAPSYAVISVGSQNSYGHPTESTLSKLRDAEVITYRTDLQGHIICTSDGTNITFQVERNKDADTLSGAGTGGNHTISDTNNTAATAVTEEAQGADSNAITYIVNINTDKFHEPSCSSVDDMAERNKLEVSKSRDQLIADGYSPCGRCKP